MGKEKGGSEVVTSPFCTPWIASAWCQLVGYKWRLLRIFPYSCGVHFSIFAMQPPRVKAFIDKVIQCPLQDIAIPLSGFHWEYGKVTISYVYLIFVVLGLFASNTAAAFSGELSSLEAIVSSF